MPTADTFRARGRRNGFPFCLPKVDVSIYDNWITLGGVSSGTATDAQINTSFVNAMKLWWNSYSVTGSFSASTSAGSISHSNKEVIIKRDSETDALTPIRRTCFGTSSSSSTTLSSSFSDEIAGEFEEPASGSLSFGGFNFVVRMYDGVTTDESNFVGYGVSQLCRVESSASVFGESTFAEVDIRVASYLNGTTSSGTAPDGTGFDNKVFQTNLSSIPFRSKTNCSANFPQTVQASELSGTANTTTPNGVSASASISSIDFWTYS